MFVFRAAIGSFFGPRSGQAMVKTLQDLKELRDAGVLDNPELRRLKAKVLQNV